MQMTKVDLSDSLRAAEEGHWAPNPEVEAVQAKVNAGLGRVVAGIDADEREDRVQQSGAPATE